MNIEKIDKNFAVNHETIGDDGLRYYMIPHPAFDLYGVFYEEETKEFRRMPSQISEKVSEGVHFLSTNTAGGRIRFSTNSSKIKLKIEYEGLQMLRHMPIFGQGGFSLFEETDKGRRYCNVFAPTPDAGMGYEEMAVLTDKDTDKMRQYILYFPLYQSIKSLSIGLLDGAKVTGGKRYKNVPPILYYGSSITQGGCASRPDNCYQAIIEECNNIDFINLGFSGSGLAEDVMVDYLSSLQCSLFVCDYDHNAPNPEYLQATHYRLYEAFRKANPKTPILFISKPDFKPNTADEQRLKIIRTTYNKAKKQGDNNVYFIAGNKFFDEKSRLHCMVDCCHPADLGFYKMATKIYNKMKKISEVFY